MSFSLLNFKLIFCIFLHYCGIRLSNIDFVIFASSILRCVCFVVFDLFGCLFRIRRRAQNAPTAKAAIEDEQSFQDEVLFLHLDVEVEVEVEAGLE